MSSTTLTTTKISERLQIPPHRYLYHKLRQIPYLIFHLYKQSLSKFSAPG